MPDSSGSAGSDDPGSGSGGVVAMPTDFDNAMLAVAVTYKSTFMRVNSTPYLSTLGAFDINTFVHGDTHDYRTIHPEDTTTAPMTISVGTVIVREVLDQTGAVAKLTMMAKGPAGYDPTLGDWWFAETDPAGKPLATDAGLQVGRLTACHGCHVPREGSDFLFGVPRIDQRSH